MHRANFKSNSRKLIKGQADHVDAWLMSYADLITLLFMVFVIFVSLSVMRPGEESEGDNGGYKQTRSGTLALGTPFDETYRALSGIVASHHYDQHIALEKNHRSITVDISALRLFEPGSAAIAEDTVPFLKEVAALLKQHMPGKRFLTVEGHTDDDPMTRGHYDDSWELSTMRAARVTSLLVKEGIDPKRIAATGYAGSRALVPNEDAEGRPILDNRHRNQRIVIRLEMAAP